MAAHNVQKLDERKAKAFNAVVNFVTDLYQVFGDDSKVTPLNLYNRLVVNHLKFTDVKRIEQALDPFAEFFKVHGKAVLASNWDAIPRGTVISFGTSDKIHLEIQKYIYQSDAETKKVIRQHLCTIQAILSPADRENILQELIEASSMPASLPTSMGAITSPADIQAALKLDDSTPEGKFISGIMNKTKDAMEGMDASNPTAALLGLAQSGIVQDLIGGLQNGVMSGEMNMGRLLQTMTGALQTLMPQSSQSSQPQPQASTVPSSAPLPPPKIEVVKDIPPK